MKKILLLIFLSLIIDLTIVNGLNNYETFPNPMFYTNLQINPSNFSIQDNTWYFGTFQGIYNLTINSTQQLIFNDRKISQYSGFLLYNTISECIQPYTNWPEEACYINPQTKISFDINCENYVLPSIDKKIWIGFVNAEPLLGSTYLSLANTSTMPFHSYIRTPGGTSGEGTYCTIKEIIGSQACVNTWKHVEFTIAEALAADKNCSVDYSLPMNGIRLAFWHEEPSSTHLNQVVDNISVENYGYDEYVNNLPQINLTVEDTICFNSSLDYINVPLNVSAFDEENDTIFYSSSLQSEEYATVTKFYDEAVVSTTCGIGSPWFFIELPRWVFGPLYSLAFCKTSKPGTFSLNPEFAIYNNRCKVDVFSKNNSNIFLDKFYNINGFEATMLVVPDNCSGVKKEALFELQTGLQDFRFETRFYYQRPLQQIKINFYNSIEPEIYVANFTLTMLYDVLWFQKSNETILTISNVANYSYDYKFLYTDFKYDYETNKFNITLDDGVNNWSIVTNGTLIANSTKLLKYVGMGTGGLNTNYRALFELFSISTFRDNLNFSNTPPSTIRLEGEYTDTYYLFYTDSYHLPLKEYEYETLTLNVIGSEYCVVTDDPTDVGEDLLGDFVNKNNYSGAMLYFSQFVWLIQFPYRLTKFFGMDFIFQLVGIVILVLFGFNMLKIGHEFSIIVLMVFALSIVFYFMKFISTIPFIILLFMSAYIIATKIFPSGGSE